MKNKLYFAALLCLLTSGMAYGQCAEDRHSTDMMHAWMSCDESMNPHMLLGESHWIQFEFDQVETIYDIYVWNLNHPDHAASGVKEMAISLSLDGATWDVVDTISIAQATTSGDYLPRFVVDLEGLSAKYLVFTALSTHGGSCAGLSEVKIYTEDVSGKPSFELDLTVCENAGLYTGLTANMEVSGDYSGAGVMDNGDGSFDFDPDVIGPGASTVTFSYLDDGVQTSLTESIEILECSDPRCPECIECGNFDQLIVDGNDIPTDKYFDDSLHSEGQVQATRDVDFRGRTEVELRPGFEVKADAEFLAQIRECHVQLLGNGSFEDDLSTWTFWNAQNVSVSYGIVTDEVFHFDKALRYEVITGSPEDTWRASVRNDLVLIEPNQSYRLSFAARGEGVPMMRVEVGQLDGTRQEYITNTALEIGESWTTHVLEFTADDITTSELLRIRFNFAGFEGVYYLDQVKLIRVD